VVLGAARGYGCSAKSLLPMSGALELSRRPNSSVFCVMGAQYFRIDSGRCLRIAELMAVRDVTQTNVTSSTVVQFSSFVQLTIYICI